MDLGPRRASECKKGVGEKDKASQMSALCPHPKETARCRDCRDRQGQEAIPPIAGVQHEAGPNPIKEDPTLELSQKATQKSAS